MPFAALAAPCSEVKAEWPGADLLDLERRHGGIAPGSPLTLRFLYWLCPLAFSPTSIVRRAPWNSTHRGVQPMG